MSKPKTLQKYYDALFNPKATSVMSAKDAEKVKRYREIYSVWIENPALSRSQLKMYMEQNYPHLSESQIYRDLNDIYILLGNVQNASRAHIQFVVNESLLETISTLRGNIKKQKELILAIGMLAKYNKLDKDAPEPVDWSQMVDFVVEPSSDPSTLGIEPIENLDELKAKLYSKYAEDIEFVEIKKDDNATSS